MRRIGKKHDLVSVVVEDPAEVEIPEVGLLELQDPESGEFVLVDTSSKSFQRDYKDAIKKRRLERQTALRRAQVDQVLVDAGGDIVQPLIGFFQRRNGR